MNDLRFAFRQLIKSPGFTAVAVLTLALGIGATTAIVSVVRTALFDPLPTGAPERLVQFGTAHPELGWWPNISPPAYAGILEQTNLFARAVAYEQDGLRLRRDDFDVPVSGMRVTSNFFRLWNVRPLLGRTFVEDDGEDVLVLSHSLWRREFGGDPDVVGQSVRFQERPMTVIGVMPRHFSFPRRFYDYWRPGEVPSSGADDTLSNTGVVAEMRSGIEIAQVQSFLDVVSARLAERFSQGRIVKALRVRLLKEAFISPAVQRTLTLLLGAIAFVLCIAAANVANLQLARTETRKQELAVRAALGAGRARVFGHLLTESLLLALLGGAVGLAVTLVGLQILQPLIPPELPRVKAIGLDSGTLVIACAVTLATGLLFGVMPAWQGRRSNLNEVLKAGAATGTTDRESRRFSRALIVGQVAVAAALLIGAGLMIRSVVGMLRFDPGYDPHNVIHVSGGGLFRPLNDPLAAKLARFDDARRRLASLPGVVGVGSAFWSHETREFATAPDSRSVQLKMQWIGVEEFDPLRVLRVPLKQGRWLNRGDMEPGAPAVLVNETAARLLWPNESPIGKPVWQRQDESEDWQAWLRRQGYDTSMIGRPYRVVGVVADTLAYSGVEVVAAAYTEEPQPRIYRARHSEYGIETAEKVFFVRTAGPPAALSMAIGRALHAAGAPRTPPTIFNLEEILRAGRASHRTVMLFLSIFAGVGLLLAAIGLYGVLAYSVARRQREIGIRMALGAQVADVMRLVLRQGLALVILGGVAGIGIALATGRLLRAYLFDVSSNDPITFFAVAVALAGVALFACWLPARHAAKIDPMKALRNE